VDPITLGILGIGAALLFGSSSSSSSSSSSFNYKRKNGTWRAYFNGTPSSMSHVLHDSDGYYVCWDRPVRTRGEMQAVADRWKKTYG
jgi:hypothetical protein